MNGAFKAIENRIQRGQSLVLGYSQFCRDVTPIVAWFDALPEEQRWQSYQEYVQSECTWESVVEGMRRSREDYLEYLAEWASWPDREKPKSMPDPDPVTLRWFLAQFGPVLLIFAFCALLLGFVFVRDWFRAIGM